MKLYMGMEAFDLLHETSSEELALMGGMVSSIFPKQGNKNRNEANNQKIVLVFFFFWLRIFTARPDRCQLSLSIQDPTDQKGLDNFMVQELDGTTNQWGWCKEKVRITT